MARAPDPTHGSERELRSTPGRNGHADSTRESIDGSIGELAQRVAEIILADETRSAGGGTAGAGGPVIIVGWV